MAPYSRKLSREKTCEFRDFVAIRESFLPANIWERGVLWCSKNEQSAKVFSTKITNSQKFSPLKIPYYTVYPHHYNYLLHTILKSEEKGRTLFLCWLRSHGLASTLQYPFQGPCSCHLCNHHHVYVHSLQECPRSQECCQPSGPWPLSQFPFPWRMLQEVRMVRRMKPCVLCDSRVLWKSYHSTPKVHSVCLNSNSSFSSRTEFTKHLVL